MNDLYANEWSLYQNHFCPNMKLLKKKRINSKYYKKYDRTPHTPYDRSTGIRSQLPTKNKERLKSDSPSRSIPLYSKGNHREETYG